MIRDWSVDGTPQGSFDVCVVGAGAVGLPLALVLARRGRRVLLLEAGDAVPERSSQDTLRGEDAGPVPHHGIDDGRFRGLGGTTNIWGGQLHPLDDIDFAERDWVAGSGWPIRRDELDPFLEEALALEGAPDVLRDDGEVWRRLHVTPPDAHRDGLELYFTRWSRRPALAALHASEIRRSDRLVVLTNAPVVDLRLDGERVTGAVVRRQDGLERTLTATEFVLCLGGIETVRFFLQPPRSGRPPWSGHPLLGASFQDHIDVDGAEVVPTDRDRFLRLFTNTYLSGYKYHPKLRLSPEVQRRERVLNVGGTMTSGGPSGQLGLAKRIVRSALSGRRPPTGAEIAELARGAVELAPPAWEYLAHHRAYWSPGSPILLRVHAEQEPLGRSRISLADERDRFGLQRARISWHVSDLEARTIATYVHEVGGALRRQGLAEVHPIDELTTDRVAARATDASHHMSGMRMATTAEHGLVDPDLRVFGTANLAVCSSAVFPTSGYSNPTHTTIALAMRLARRLDGRLDGHR